MSYTHLVAYQNAIGLACYATNLVQIHLQKPKTDDELVNVVFLQRIFRVSKKQFF